VDGLTERAAEMMYRRHAEHYAAATQRFDRKLARAAWTWAVRKGYCRVNPWAVVQPIGRPNRGKPQLRPAEAARLQLAAEVAAAGGHYMAVAVLCCLELGLRASEALGIKTRNVDGGVLFVEGTKTASARRRIELPAGLRGHLERLAAGKAPGDLLMPGWRQSLHAFTRRLCERAEVPRVGPHALRGTHASLATIGGASVEAVARVLGHARIEVTRQHYVDADAATSASVGAVQATLQRAGIVPESFH
jgi:integrase